ncbi:MAG: LPS-assembly protein LptD [Candidatus Omnitrophica bacterium]|nr:LPS-assembly protein LptD [Candidatus Omnitrophota bacterium]
MSQKLRALPRAAFILAMVYACAANAEELSSKEPIVVNGDHVEYLQAERKVIGTGNISITYKDITLTCEKITVNLDTHDAEAIGNVNIVQKDAYFLGDKIIYNFESRAAIIDTGYLNAKPFYGRAENISKVPGKEVYLLKDGNITTCDLDIPHYRIQAKEVEIHPGDKVIARHIVAYIGSVPIFYIPYYVQPLTEEKKSHITVIPGQDKDWGYYALTAYRYYFNDKSRGDVLLDYRSKKGLGYGVNHYLDTDAGKGAFKVYYTQENDNLAFEKTGAQDLRYRYQYRHKWDIKNTDTAAVLEFNYLSDPYFIRDYFYNEYQELGANPDTYLSFITSKPDYTTEFLVRKRFNDFYSVVERLPEYKVDIMNWKVGNTGLYFSDNSSIVYLNQTHEKGTTTPTVKDIGAIRFDTYNQLSYPLRFFRTFSLTPYAGIRETYYSRNKWGNTNEVRTLFREGADLSMRFYRIFDVKTNFLDLDINQLRHIISPSANYRHVHQPTISPDNLTQFDSIDALDTENGVFLSLENKLQTKRFDGENMKSADLLRFIVSSDYLFRLEKQSLDFKSNKFNGIDFKLELIPYSWLYVNSDMHVNTKKCIVETANIDFVATGDDKWSVAMGQRYYDLTTGRSYQITMDIRYKFNEKWVLRAYERFDLITKKFEQQEYTLSRDLHCWIADFTLDVTDINNVTFWLIMRMKAFPNYPIGLKQTYSRPRFGEAGATGSD